MWILHFFPTLSDCMSSRIFCPVVGILWYYWRSIILIFRFDASISSRGSPTRIFLFAPRNCYSTWTHWLSRRSKATYVVRLPTRLAKKKLSKKSKPIKRPPTKISTRGFQSCYDELTYLDSYFPVVFFFLVLAHCINYVTNDPKDGFR